MRRRRWRAAGASLCTLFLLAGCGRDYRPQTFVPSTPEQKATVQTVVAFNRAIEDADAEALLRLVTDGFLDANFTKRGVTRDALLAEPDLILGRQAQRRIEFIEVQGDKASALFDEKIGDRSLAIGRIGLVQQGDKWLVDSVGAATIPLPEDLVRARVDMSDFSFDSDLASVETGEPILVSVSNQGAQDHVMALWRVTLAGESPIELIESTDTPPGDVIAASGRFAPGESGDIVINGGLPKGRYLLVCSLTDVTSPEATPHYDRGMVSDFNVG